MLYRRSRSSSMNDRTHVIVLIPCVFRDSVRLAPFDLNDRGAERYEACAPAKTRARIVDGFVVDVQR